VDGLETDACLTADGRLALLHDPWLSGGTSVHGWAHQTAWRELRTARLRDRHGAVTGETPMLLEELLESVPGDLPVQIEVKAHGDPELARVTAATVCRLARTHASGRRIELLSFHTRACEEAARLQVPARLVIWADYAPGALLRWAANAGVGGVCIEPPRPGSRPEPGPVLGLRQPAGRSTARIRGWPSIFTWSITSTSGSPTTRPRRRRLSGVNPQ